MDAGYRTIHFPLAEVPFPPFVMTAATVPAVVLVLVLVGAVLAVRDDLAPRSTGDATSPPGGEPARGTFAVPLPAGWRRCDGLLFAMMAAFPLVLIALPSTPIFGGTKHWITAYPFFALLAARAWARLSALPSVT